MNKAMFMIIPFILSCAKAVDCPPCSPKVIEKPIIMKCQIPEVPVIQLEKITEQDGYDTRLQKLIRNYGLIKEENMLLRKAIDVCR